MGEKIKNLEEVIVGEKDVRMQWIERYENEQKDNALKTGYLNNARAELREAQMARTNTEIEKDQIAKQLDSY